MIFPSAQALADADVARVGLPRARAAAIRGLARAVCNGELSLDASTDLEVFVERFVRLQGVGDWTARYVAMRALGEPDAFPASDLGLLRAAAGGNGKLDRAKLLQRAERWRPWRAYAAMCLWKTDTAKRTRTARR